MNFFQFNNEFQKVNADVVIEKSINATVYEVLVLNKQQLYNYGIDSEGKKIKYKSRYYAQEKFYDNPRPGLGNADLFVTGMFYNGFYSVVKGNFLETGSNDSKSSKLENDYGKQIFGLTKPNKVDYANDSVIPKIREELRILTGFRF